jgi:hypothetical protein
MLLVAQLPVVALINPRLQPGADKETGGEPF